MLIDKYHAEERLWLVTLNSKTSAGQSVFRGDFVVVQGELNETAGKRAPPKALLKQCVILADAEKILFVSGNFASIEEVPEFITRFEKVLAPDCVPVFFVDNIPDSSVAQVGDHRYVLIELREGMAWNALMDELYIEKSDLKGLDAEEKVTAVYEASRSHAFKYPQRTLDDVLASKTDAKREGWGAI
jgi:hypothetical protein